VSHWLRYNNNIHHIVTGRDVIQKEKIIFVVVVALYTDLAKNAHASLK
jgi:hypothetical protein